MKEEASKKPFSFHVNAAFAPWSFWLEEWKIPVMHYYTCKLLSDMGYYEEIYEFVKLRGGSYFESLSTEIEIKMKS